MPESRLVIAAMLDFQNLRELGVKMIELAPSLMTVTVHSSNNLPLRYSQYGQMCNQPW